MDANTNTATLSSMPSDANANRPKSPETQRFELKPTQELRFQVAVSEAATLKLVSGNAEIFGTEIVSGKVYEFSQTKLAVFTWHGCILELSGKYTSAYVGEETPMDYYINIHHGLHKLRLQAAQEKRSGPRVMLVGPTDSGKSSVSRILINYAIRHDMRPTYVDLDVGQNSISPPGCVAAIPMFRPVDVEEGYSLLAPLAFFYGHENLSANPTNFKHQTLQLAKALSLQADKDPVSKLLCSILFMFLVHIINLLFFIMRYFSTSSLSAHRDPSFKRTTTSQFHELTLLQSSNQSALSKETTSFQTPSFFVNTLIYLLYFFLRCHDSWNEIVSSCQTSSQSIGSGHQHSRMG
eukprot:TRINITY_DN7001_c0_g1_i4.p1 TRINITY_DN7001_c0_g1~~TRINITY_DN7001_c0_g1_i4.p1  ORF type:complete len:351 (+),score=62.83 TRINITY_DN7001_c0_g1_i4:56-1108(+)